MKKQHKGIILGILFGGSLIFWATASTLPAVMPGDSGDITVTGTPMDFYPDEQRSQFCESSETAKSNSYVTEYKIPTPCTQPVAITTDPYGNVWFAQTNTGNLTKFDPTTETFTEYYNVMWPAGFRSMIWGIDYSPDNKIWFTDEAGDAIWKFSIDEKRYDRTQFPAIVDALPQKLSVVGANIIINDFTGNKLSYFDPNQSNEGLAYVNIPSPVEGSVTGAFTIDSKDNLWYTNWIFQQGGVLVKLNQTKLLQEVNTEDSGEQELFDFIDIFQFPPGMTTPNGIASDPQDNLWIADTSSSYFFKFEPETERFTRYVTSDPPISAYGNSSGLVFTPISRPYWALFDNGKLFFNEQTANRIGIFEPENEKLVEYIIPSANPNWADCQGLPDCGIAQVFDFQVDGDKIWFTEWVENNIGVVDTSIPLPFNVKLDKSNLSLNKGEETQIQMILEPTTNNDIHGISLVSSTTAPFSDLIVEHDAPSDFQLDFDGPRVFQIKIKASPNALPDIHKILIGATTNEVTVSQYVSVIIEQ